jgi:hypothetical protein
MGIQLATQYTLKEQNYYYHQIQSQWFMYYKNKVRKDCLSCKTTPSCPQAYISYVNEPATCIKAHARQFVWAEGVTL